jgi:hypothetical protein
MDTAPGGPHAVPVDVTREQERPLSKPGQYWSIERCGWVASPASAPALPEVPEQRDEEEPAPIPDPS